MSTLRVSSVETTTVKSSTGTSALTINSDGRVLRPALIAFDVTRPTATAVSAVNTVIFETVNSNIGSAYNSSNGRFTAPIAGYYQFNATGGNSTSFFYDICKNGSIYRRGERGASNGGFVWVTTSVTMYLLANDYVSIIVNNGDIRWDAPYAGFSGFLIG